MGFALLTRGAPAPDDDYWYQPRGTESASGVAVTPSTAIAVSGVYACVRLISQTIAQLPLKLYRRTAEGREPAVDHPVYRVIHEEPNPEADSHSYWGTVGLHLGFRGNHYSYIERDGGGQLTGLRILLPDDVLAKRTEDGELFYLVRENNQWNRYPARKILHIPDMSNNGVTGLSPLQAAAESIGHYIAARDHGASFLKQGAKFPGIINRPKDAPSWKPETREKFSEDWERKYGGSRNAGKTPMLEDGMVYQVIGITPEDAQLLETMRFGVDDIARIFGVPPHLINSLDRATFANITEQDREYIRYHMRPRLNAIAKRVAMKLLLPDERADYYCEHEMGALLMGTPSERSDEYQKAILTGWMSRDEARQRENMPPIPGGKGATFLVPVNMAAAPGDSQPPVQTPGDQLVKSISLIIEDVLARAGRRERQDVSETAVRMLKRDGIDALSQWAVDWYSGDHSRWLAERIAPAIQGCGSLLIAAAGRSADARVTELLRRYGRRASERLAGEAARALISAAAGVDGGDPARVIGEHFGRIDHARTAKREAARLRLAVERWCAKGE